MPSDEFPFWGFVSFSAGERNLTELHFHDCDEYVFMISGKILMRSEGIDYIMGPRDVLVTRMGDEHQLLEILEDASYFWCEGALRGLKRPGHLHRGVHEPSPNTEGGR